MKRVFAAITSFLTLVVALCPGCGMPAPIRVMTFNIRYGTANDGENCWDNRRELVFETIRAYQPDVFGLQEALAFQVDELCEAFPDYKYVGVGRDDGVRAGEFVPIFYLKQRFKLVRGGHFWLSDEPERPGHIGWDAVCPRMVTYAALRYTESPLNEFCVINTHFDHRGKQARRESAVLVRNLVESLAGRAFVVMGDFNCAPGSAPYRTLTADTGNLAELTDPFVWLESDLADTGTFHGFTGQSTSGRIDWILHNRRFKPLAVDIIRHPYDGRYPSDHFPVTATLQLCPATRHGSF